MSQIVKAGDMILVGLIVPEGYDGDEISIVFDDFCNEPHGWVKSLEGCKAQDNLALSETPTPQQNGNP